MRRLLFALILAGAALLVAAQFLPLFSTHVASQQASVGSGTVGSAHGYGVVAIGVLAGVLGLGVLVTGNRYVLVLVGLLGVAGLVIALGHDLSHARDAGTSFVGGHYETAKDVVGVGLYVEIAGSLALLLATVYGFLLGPETLSSSWRVSVAPGAGGPGASGPRRRARSEVIERRSRSESEAPDGPLSS